MKLRISLRSVYSNLLLTFAGYLGITMCSLACYAQSTEGTVFNLDFENTSGQGKLPDKCLKWGMDDYAVQLDTTTVYSGKYSVAIFPQAGAGQQSFGSISHPISANYTGSNIVLEGYMKLENVEDGFAGLMLRIDGEGRSLGFDNMQERNIQGTQDWKQYTVSLPYPEGAERIYVAGLLTGTGKAWFDDFTLSIDGTDVQQIVPVEKPKPLATQDQEFDEGSSIELENLTDTQIQNFYTLGKVWGFVKYRHPKVAEGDVNWDYELIRVLPKIIESANQEAAQQAMTAWIQKLGEVAIADKKLEEPDPSSVKLLPDTAWITDDLLVSELQNELFKISNAESFAEHYYLGFTPNVGNPIFKNEAKYSAMDFTDDGFTLLSLFRYWNMIEYFFPNRHLMNEDWDAVLQDFIPQMVAVEDELSYKLTLLELIGKIQDTHANIWQQDDALREFWGQNTVPVELGWIEDQVVITKVFPNFDGLEPLTVGDIVTEVNGISVATLIAEKSKYSPASNRPTQLRDVMRKLLRTNDDTLKLVVQDKGKVSVPTTPIGSSKLRSAQVRPDSHRMLEDSIGYIYPGSLAQGEINQIMDKFMDTRGLIIDLRCYPSDFIVFSLGQYLMSEPTEFVTFTTGSMQSPGLFTYGNMLKVGEEREGYYRGKVVILINETTQSQAEYTTMALRVAPAATVVGSTTAGADGNVSEIYLPGNVRTMISGIGVYYPDRTETQRVGIGPDIELSPTVEGIRAGEDELLNKAKELINS
ncbi:MAG: S41 family peptidase [Bacteroidota bacterium]